MEKDYLLVYKETDVQRYTSIEQLVHALPGIVINSRYVDPVEGCMIFKLNATVQHIETMKEFLEIAGIVERMELYEQKPI